MPLVFTPPIAIVENPPVVETVEDKINNYAKLYNADAKLALRIAKAESGLNPEAYNPEWHYNAQGEKICQGSFGIYQVSCVHYDGDDKDLLDPDINIRLAFQLQKEQGWDIWGAYSNKSYLKH